MPKLPLKPKPDFKLTKDIIMAKSKLPVIEGTAMWAKVFEPDCKFNPDGDYTINIQMPVADSIEVSEKLDSIVQAEFDKAVEKDPRLKNQLSTRPVCQPVFDRDTGDDTGNVEFKFKLKAKIKRKDGTTFEQRPTVFDSKVKPMDKSALIGNGSKVKVAFEPIPYVMPATKQVGVSLRLKAVQVLELVEYGTSATSVFDEEDGYVAPSTTAANSEDEVFANAADF
jgi:hypothetical protein